MTEEIESTVTAKRPFSRALFALCDERMRASEYQTGD